MKNLLLSMFNQRNDIPIQFHFTINNLNLHDAESVNQFQQQYRQIAKLLAELAKTKADDE